jgi:hypothetical protein
LALVVLLRSAYAPGPVLPPKVELVIVRLPPVIWMPPPPMFALPRNVGV